MRFGIRGKIVAPLLRLGEAFEEGEATAHALENVRHEDHAAHKLPSPTERHGEANAIVEERSVGGFDETMVVLEAAEAAGGHTVLEEVRRIPGLGLDQRDVIIDEAELQSLPAHRVARGDEPCDTAFNRMHAE